MTVIRLQHTSCEFSDSAREHEHDAEAIFGHAEEERVWACTGTEAGKSGDLRDILAAAARRHGFNGFFHASGEWVALSKRYLYRFMSAWEGPWIPGTHGLSAAQGGHSPRGCAYMAGEALDGPDIGRLTFGAQHWLTERSIQKTGVSNEAMIEGTARWARTHGAGRNKVFLGADANTNDARLDVFQGKPMTSAADELGKHPATHGRSTERGSVIDVIASYDQDQKVKALRYQVLDDSRLRLNGDHFLLLAAFGIET